MLMVSCQLMNWKTKTKTKNKQTNKRTKKTFSPRCISTSQWILLHETVTKQPEKWCQLELISCIIFLMYKFLSASMSTKTRYLHFLLFASDLFPVDMVPNDCSEQNVAANLHSVKKLRKIINVTKHLANQLLYRNSHKSNQIKSNVGFWWEGKTRVPGGKPLIAE